MTEFDNWYNNIEKEYPLYQDKDGYNIGNIRALKVGWKAALEWALTQETSICYSIPIVVTDIIRKELEGE